MAFCNVAQRRSTLKESLHDVTRRYTTLQVDLKESWYEKLQRWDDASAAYERKQREDPHNLTWTLGRMRCQHALGEWGALCQLAREKWRSGELEDADMRAEVARLAAAAAWNLRLWGEMEHYCASIPKDSFDSNFFRAVLAIHSNSYPRAQAHIDDARRILDSEFTASVGESYRRAYRSMIQVQQLSELEEMLQHKQEPNAMPLNLLVDMWRGRLVQVASAFPCH
jgi:serine/threonine-protein kinase mTOR